MQIDIAIIIILLIFAFLGFKNGLAHTLFHAFGWLIAVAVSFFLHGRVEAFLMEHTTIYDRYCAYTEKIIRTFMEKHADKLIDNMQGIIGDSLEKLRDDLVAEASEKISESTAGLFVFIGFALLIKLALFVITNLISKRHRGGFVGGLDGLAGMLIGMAQGILVVFVLLALLMPVAFAIEPEYWIAANSMLDRAVFSDILYDHNPLISIINGYLPDGIFPEDWADRLTDGADSSGETLLSV